MRYDLVLISPAKQQFNPNDVLPHSVDYWEKYSFDTLDLTKLIANHPTSLQLENLIAQLNHKYNIQLSLKQLLADYQSWIKSHTLPFTTFYQQRLFNAFRLHYDLTTQTLISRNQIVDNWINEKIKQHHHLSAQECIQIKRQADDVYEQRLDKLLQRVRQRKQEYIVHFFNAHRY